MTIQFSMSGVIALICGWLFYVFCKELVRVLWKERQRRKDMEPIFTFKQHQRSVRRIQALTKEHEEAAKALYDRHKRLETLVAQAEVFEKKYFPIPKPTPKQAAEFRREQETKN